MASEVLTGIGNVAERVEIFGDNANLDPRKHGRVLTAPHQRSRDMQCIH
ncbi:hypothetical protein PPTG_21160 [Phytophthora nicotianae INRA-310]|uniref:Uncharacterized protein n=1 Tax=Phytophthora nicotianae (strain INRA-310) TaxID=761204 RepID=W2R933_PHYN3|nr:hypothetical protein PPTG_21160 [Phytophthora nicotianae INRA-310]ETN21887.1 hypothetical protein PPTG_21160 [Phytophthora nicotianae INRA-310]